MVKIVTMCSKGLVRSVALADVLKLHFEPVDVILIGCNSNSEETIKMLSAWADKLIAMEQRYVEYFPQIGQRLFLINLGLSLLIFSFLSPGELFLFSSA